MIAWLCANGALWDAMQVAAWSKMFAGYAETMPVSDALRETFDASKPCEMCRGIAKAKNDTEKQLPLIEQSAAAKFVLVIQPVDAPVFANDRGDWRIVSLGGPCERTDPVPVPPPRA